jgi:ADP-ribosylglycohydrolase
MIVGDSDTLACITGGIAEAYYGEIPQAVADMVNDSLEDNLLDIVNSFTQRYVRR